MADSLIEKYDSFQPELINRQYEENHIRILEVTKELTRLNGKCPTFKMIATETKLHPMTIYNHYKAMRMSDVKPSYKKYAYEVLDRHIELMRQSEDLAIALRAVLTLEERLFDILPEADVKVSETKRLVLEIDDKRKELEDKHVVPANFTDVTDED